MFTAVLPPTDESTADTSVVGTVKKFIPLKYVAAKKPPRSPVTPPPKAISESLLVKLFFARNSAIFAYSV